MKKFILLTMVLCILFSAVACGTPAEVPTTIPAETTVPETTVPETEPPVTTPPEPQEFVLTFIGDCTLGTCPGLEGSTGSFINIVGHDYDYPFRNVVQFFEDDDFTMANLEGVLGDKGYRLSKQFNFRGPAEYVNILTGNSIEAVTLANNHTEDYGPEGYAETKRILTEAELPFVETDSSTLVTTESGLVIGLYAAKFTIDQADLESEVAALREQGAEIVVFAVHWGSEGHYRPAPYQVQQAYDAIDAGVDIVYGTHPHVLQKIEEYNGGVIYYSLGNFCFGGNHYPADLNTVIVRQSVIRETDGTVHLAERELIPCSITSEKVQNVFQPTPYEVGSYGYNCAMNKLFGTWNGGNLLVDYSPKPEPTDPPETEAPTTPPATEAPTTPTTPPSEVPSTPPSGGTESGGDSGSDSGTSGGETPAPDPVPSPDPTPAPDPAPAPDPDPAPDAGSEG